MNRKRLLLLGVAIVGLFTAGALLATNFQIYEVSGSYYLAVWPGSTPVITWNLNFTSLPANVNENGTGVTPQTVLANAFNTWQSATSPASEPVTNISFTFGSANNSFAQGPEVDCVNVVGFADPNAATDFGTGVIAFASIGTTNSGGGAVPFTYTCGSVTPNPTCPLQVCIVDVDIMFNPGYTFATSEASGSQYDLQSVATHEIGHLMGLDHSNIAHAIMYPYGDTSQIGVHTALTIDDMVGVGHLYAGPGSADYSGGQITGTVTLGGANLYAADVQAIDATTGNVVTENLTSPSGVYKLRVYNGTYYVYVQSLAPNQNSGPTMITNFKGQAGYGNNSFGSIPSNPTNYTGLFY